MRIAAFGATLLFAFAACSTTSSTENPYQQPNSLMNVEIARRVEQIPYQHRDELLQNLMWMVQTGEQTTPAMLEALRHENPKVRCSAAWVLGRMRDHRTIPNLQSATRDSDPTVRLEVARTLVLLGDLAWSPTLIEGLDSDKKEVRYMCHEALRTATGHDFGYDHMNSNETELRVSVLRWRQWWSEYSGDGFFAQSYQQKYGVSLQPAAPMAEQKPTNEVTPQPAPENQPAQPEPQSGNQGIEPSNEPLPHTGSSPTPAPKPTPRPNGG